MTDMQWFAFVILPVCLMIAATVIGDLIVRHGRWEAASQAAKRDVK
jgi:hypothetical protein